ncbi:MAG: saccharopine dehydrogenase NADP-binding domain-containing protein [Planctomycetes bacterium]|nr:saccharopine dehydrogenase NADP-binding domain-containing protein [Planctomycetota bacterium]
MRMLVLGAGLQGSAAAFDLLQNKDVKEVRLADLKVDSLRPFLARFQGDARFKPMALDVKDPAAVKRALTGVDAALSAVPYYFNGPLSKLAAEMGVHWCDLGGNTEIVKEQQKLAPLAKSKGITILPDCGLAPGLVNILAEAAIRQLDRVDSCKLLVGGLPQRPEPPLNYQLVYSLEGVLDYYTTPSWVLQEGQPATRVALSEREPIEMAGVGKLEAFHTAGGLSTMFEKYRGKIRTMEYKTLRYPGHAAIMEALRELGFFDTTPIDVKGQKVAPRDVTVATLLPKLSKPASPDLVALRVVVEGTKVGQPAKAGYELVDRMDETNGITAMMRTTGYSLSITAQMQARREVGPAGVFTPDECMPADRYLAELAKRGVVARALA